MNIRFHRVSMTVAGGVLAILSFAQPEFTFIDQKSGESVKFINDTGTAVQSGNVVVFDGFLTTDQVVEKTAYENKDWVSVRLLVQCKLFEFTPDQNDVGTVQGGFYILKDEGEHATTGQAYGWGDDNGTLKWFALKEDGDPVPFNIEENARLYVTFRLNYTDENYQILIGPDAWTEIASQELSMPGISSKNGINGINLKGIGGLEAFASSGGAPIPLSSSVGFNVYADNRGVIFIVDLNDEQSGGAIVVKALINGEWIEVGRTMANGSEHYEFRAHPGLLEVGKNYSFRVIDEVGNPHAATGQIAIKTIRMESVILDPEVLHVTFNSEPGRSYQVISAASLDSEEWGKTLVYSPPLSGEQWKYSDEPFIARDANTTIKIPRNESRAFFKIRLVTQ